ncbi:lysin B [Mycobacterium phage Chy4]|uniref:endolysin n=1 Tax=Mycobacterium phage Chy5 TaxID=1327948 RepID=UPI00032B4665|nr:endolysin [Mycobacterium phage Chy5]YP_008060168.1 endolysin [Mycobacterium phage Chy4]AGK85970.1 lysin B [Mycobacterium phage Chy4]AGK86043.1 lysin B [Mycobacterium phage Chy5]
MSKPWLFTVHGTGQPDPLGPGLPADTARDVLDIYRWQPIGNYPAAAFPMWPSVEKGVAELILQIELKLDADPYADFAMAGYSQGAIVVGQVLKHHILPPTGRLHRFLHRLKKVIFWGNPMRQKGFVHSDEWIHPVAAPDTLGILEDRLENLEQYGFEVRDYAHDGDMYASIKEDDMHEYEVAIGRIVMKASGFIGGRDSVVAQLIELGQRPITEGIALAGAIIDALTFFARSRMGDKWPHLYNRYPAVEFLRQI